MLPLLVRLAVVLACLSLSCQSGMVPVMSGTTLFYSHHADPQCMLPSHGLTRPRLADGTPVTINTCLSSASANLRLVCKKGAGKMTVMQRRYPSSDSSCSSTSPSQSVYLHGYPCEPSPEGGYMLLHCGEDASPLLTGTAVLAAKLFTDSSCTLSATLSRRTQLGVCTPRYQGRGQSIEYNFIVNVKAAAAATAGLVVMRTRFSPQDTTCSGRFIRAPETISYATAATQASSKCLVDPLHPKYFYSNAPTGGGVPFFETYKPTTGSVFGTSEWTYLVKTYFTDTACTPSKAVALNITALGPCIANYASSKPTGTYYSQSMGGSLTTLTTLTYSDSRCATVPISTVAQSLSTSCTIMTINADNRRERQNFNSPSSYQYSLSSTVPAVRGVVEGYFQTFQACSAFAKAPSAPSRISSIRAYTTGVLSGPSFNGHGGGDSGWYETTWSTLVSGDATYIKVSESVLADGSTTSTATFVGGTGNLLSTTLTITNARCIDKGYTSTTFFCDVSSFDENVAIAPGVYGTSGQIKRGMVVTYSGSSATMSDCSLVFATHVVTCTLSTALRIPDATALTGVYTQDSPIASIPMVT